MFHLHFDEKDPLSCREVYPLQIIDYLLQFGSPVHIVPLAEVIRGGGNISFPDENHMIDQWKKGLASIRQKTAADLTFLKERVREIDLSSAAFLAESGQEIHKAGYLLLSRLARLQEAVGSVWRNRSFPEAVLPALELFLYNGELVRFQDTLYTLQKTILSSYTKIWREWNQREDLKTSEGASEAHIKEKYYSELEQTGCLLKQAFDFVLSFYDRKWTLFLAPPSAGRELKVPE
ncbi:MAG: hypothetical protein ACMUIA_03105 [bacterium]